MTMTIFESKLFETLKFEAHAAAVFAALRYQRHPEGDETKTCDKKFIEWFMHHARLRGGWCYISQLRDSWHLGWGLPEVETWNVLHPVVKTRNAPHAWRVCCPHSAPSCRFM
jgi:hypothetical protein